MGSCSMQAMYGGHQEIFSHASTAGTRGDGFVSIYVPEGYR